MKNINYKLLLLLFLFSCNKKNIEYINSNQKLQDSKFLYKEKKIYDIENDTILLNNYIKGDDIVESIRYSLVTDSSLINNIKNNYVLSHLYYYSPIKKEKFTNIFTVVGGWDYNETIFLISKDKTIYKDFIILAEQSGDGGDFYGKTAEYKNGEFISEFEEKYSTLSCPIDTTTYYKKGRTRIWIDEKGKIHEDTLEIKRNFIITEKNNGCE